MLEIYTTERCIRCDMTKRQADKLGIPYTSDLATNAPEDVRQLIDTLRYQSAPVVIVRDDEGYIIDHWNGYRIEEIRKYATGQ